MTQRYSLEDLYLPAGSTAGPGTPVSISPASADWIYSGLLVSDLEPGDTLPLDTQAAELLIVPLRGGCSVDVDGKTFGLTGRPSIFEGLTDVVYVPLESDASLFSTSGGTYAICSAVATRRYDPFYLAADDIDVEIRGAGRCTRQVVNMFIPGVGQADKLMVVEVFTPSGNFSSFPPHKHDEFDDATGEAEVEEIYYFRFDPADGFGLYRQYGRDNTYDVTTPIFDGDVFLVPEGYHGPSVPVPGYDMYFLNVLAGPSFERTMANADDPTLSHIKESWLTEDADSRLPLVGATKATPHSSASSKGEL